jgi:hypothetical protein
MTTQMIIGGMIAMVGVAIIVLRRPKTIKTGIT